jgi:hypothetical protein
MLTAGDAERNLPRLYWNTEPLLYVGVYVFGPCFVAEGPAERDSFG